MKRALVTGGGGAIGTAVCRCLAAAGMHVIVHANRNLEAAEVLAADLCAAGQSAQATSFDVGNAEQVARSLETLLADGPIQVVVNSRGRTTMTHSWSA